MNFKQQQEEKENVFFSEEKNIQDLVYIQKIVQSMSKFNQIEVLRILKSDDSIILNENKYGIFVNLTELKNDVIHKIKNFINYINTQEMNLIQIENQKEIYKNNFFDPKIES
jgi:hypothetical protein